MITLRSTYADGESWKTLYRLTNDAGVSYASGSIVSVTCAVFDLSGADPTADIYDSFTFPLPVSSVFFDTHQFTDGWSADAIGFNFKHTINSNLLIAADILDPDPVHGAHVYKVEYLVTTNTDGVRQIRHFITVTSQGNT